MLYSNGTMPTDYGFTGQHSDSTTGLDYYNARYYDPVASQFTSADTMLPGDGADPWGLSRYAYVEGNPIGRVDPTGHCPWCIAAVVGALVGGAISAGSQIITSMQHGQSFGDAVKHVDLLEVGKAMLVGAVVGATGGAAGAAIEGAIAGIAGTSAVASIGGAIVGGAAVGAGEGALGQVGDNVLHGRNWSDDVGQAAIFGAVTGGIGGGAGAIARRYGSRILKAAVKAFGGEGEGCSFSADTPVATPNGEQAIGTLNIGDNVVAYDSTTGKASQQTVEHVWVNHDADLIDVTLQPDSGASAHGADSADAKWRDAAVASHGLRAPPSIQANRDRQASQGANAEETIHTTATHPWLTADRGWEPAGSLRESERVVREDGTPAMVVQVRVVQGAATMYNLTVSHIHTFVVGNGKYVVHNVCPIVKAGDAGAYKDLLGTGGDGLTPHHMPQGSLAGHYGFDYRRGGAIVMEHLEHTRTLTYGGRAIAVKNATIRAGLTFRQALARDILDYRSIVPDSNASVRSLLGYWRSYRPDLMAK